MKSALVRCSLPSSRTMPKSDSRARTVVSPVVPSAPSRMLAGLMSRCTMCWACT